VVPGRSKRRAGCGLRRVGAHREASQPTKHDGRNGRLASSPPRRSRNRTTRPVRRSGNGAELAGGAHPVQESESDLSGVVPRPGGKKIAASGLQFPTDTRASLAVGPARCRLPSVVLRSRSRGTSGVTHGIPSLSVPCVSPLAGPDAGWWLAGCCDLVG
jgi:hypothetical protein